MHRGHMLFHPIDSTAPGFHTGTVDSTSIAFSLQSSGLREWDGPTSRAVRFASKTADDYYVCFGSSTIVAASSDSILLLGGTVESIHPIKPSITYVAVVSSTDVDVNIVLGYGK